MACLSRINLLEIFVSLSRRARNNQHTLDLAILLFLVHERLIPYFLIVRSDAMLLHRPLLQ